jgi:hypothetical protein
MPLTRVLYISGSIGLGHAGRDLAIANALRRLNPGIEIVWHAGDPARRLLAEAGETLLPQSAAFAEETAEAAGDGFEKHFEQNLVVAERLARHRAGKRMRYAQTTPEQLADTIAGLIGSEASWPAIPSDGARRAAELINELAPTPAPAPDQQSDKPYNTTTVAPTRPGQGGASHG